MDKERLARMIVFLSALLAAFIPIAAWWFRNRTPIVYARMAENGGWSPSYLQAEVGKPLRLRLTSTDVLHGFAVGQSDQHAVDVKPGEFSEVTLTFSQPGRYTFYCTRWCGLNHWRMRGVIEVDGPEGTPEAAKPPLYLELGLDLDAPRQADVLPEMKPSAARGAQLEANIPTAYLSQEYFRAHSPVELWKALRSESSLTNFTDQQIWDLVALIWRAQATPEALREGQRLYAANCAACHGEQGGGDGVFAGALERTSAHGEPTISSGESTVRPADFTDARRMLAASPALLQGKILRGGMGSGMPYWGPIFTDEQSWALVAYLYTFQFDMEDKP